jgi:hypothetical protein
MRKYFLILFFGFQIGMSTAFACKPAPPANTNWLNYKIVFDSAALPPGLSLQGSVGLWISVKNTSGKKLMGRTASIDGKGEYKEIPPTFSLPSYEKVELPMGTTASFSQGPSEIIVPKPTEFFIDSNLGTQKIVLPGKIVYEKNPTYDPLALKKWSDPCK